MTQFTQHNTDGYSDTQLTELNRRADMALATIDLDNLDTDTEVKHICEKILTAFDSE